MDTVTVGTRVRLTGTFTPAGSTTPTAPTAVAGRSLSPSGVATDITPTVVSTGVVYVEQTLTEPGVWTLQISGTGLVQAADKERVRATRGI